MFGQIHQTEPLHTRAGADFYGLNDITVAKPTMSNHPTELPDKILDTKGKYQPDIQFPISN